MGMLMLIREDKLRLMGGSYNGRDDDWEDPNDIANDDYWKNNYKDTGEDALMEMMYKGEMPH
jgi:hypothetical protein